MATRRGTATEGGGGTETIVAVMHSDAIGARRPFAGALGGFRTRDRTSRSSHAAIADDTPTPAAH